MLAEEKLSDLAARRRMLVMQADLHRAMLRAECVKLRERVAWLSPAKGKSRGGPWLLVGSVATGLLAARHWRTAVKIMPVALGAWRWFNKSRSPRKAL